MSFSRNVGFPAVVLAATLGLATAGRSEILDDFSGSSLDTTIWQALGPKTYTVSGGLLTWNEDGGDWAKGEISTQQAYFLPPDGETTTVTWVVGPGAVTTDNGGTSIRVQFGLVSANETADTREHWGNSTGGIWLDCNEILLTSTAQVGVNTLAANDTKNYGGDATYIAEVYQAPWNWQSDFAVFRVEITSETFTWFHETTQLGTYSWADYDIDTEFGNGFHVWIMGQNSSSGRGRTSVDQIEIDNAFVGSGLITSFVADPTAVTGGNSSTLRFVVDPSATVTIEPGFGEVSHTGGAGEVSVPTEEVTATTTVVYTLTASIGENQDSRQASLTIFPIPQVDLVEFVDEFEGNALDTDLWNTKGDRTLSVTGGSLVAQNNGGNWGHGQVTSVSAYKLPGPGETTAITWTMGPASITTDPGGNALRYQIGIVSGEENDGWSFEHYKNTTGGTWLDLTEIQSGNTNSISGAIYHANNTKPIDSNATQLPGGIFLDNWNWQSATRAVTLLMTEAGFTWLDGSDVLGGASWDSVGLDTEFLTGYRIMAAALNYDTGRGVMAFDSVSAVSTSEDFDFTGILADADSVEIGWDTQLGASYTLNCATSPAGPWSPLAADLTSESSQYTDSPLIDAAFYQVVKIPPPPILRTSFEADEDLSGWTVSYYFGTPPPVWEVGVPTSGPSAAHTGTQVYGTNLDGNYSLLDEAGLRSPVIDLTGVSQASLTFYHWYSLEEIFDYGYIYVLDEAGNRLIPDPIASFTGTSNDWELGLVPLPAAAIGQRIRLEFYLYSDIQITDIGWYIDDVEVK